MIADRTGLSVKTIRFDSDKGLINSAGRTEGKYILFDETSELELKLETALRSLDMPVDEARTFIETRRSGDCSCERLQARMRQKKNEIATKMQYLLLLQEAIDGMLANWEECEGRNG